MILPLVILSAVAVTMSVGLIVWCSRLERERGAALSRERDAIERLIQARRDGYEVPEPVPTVAVDLPNEPPLIPELQTMVDEWESDVAKMAQLGAIRRLINSGKSQAEVALALSPKEVSVEPEVAL